jgi:hypothetical protein
LINRPDLEPDESVAVIIHDLDQIPYMHDLWTPSPSMTALVILTSDLDQ